MAHRPSPRSVLLAAVGGGAGHLVGSEADKKNPRQPTPPQRSLSEPQ